MNHNLFTALRAAFPKDLDAIAVESVISADSSLNYSWRDLDRATAMMANLLASLDLPKGARVAVQVEKSVEAMVLYLATLRAGYVFLPLNTAYQSAEIEYFVGNAEPSVVVCSPANFGWVSKIAFKAGTQNVFTLGDDRTGSLLRPRRPLQRPAHARRLPSRRFGRHFVHQRHDRAQQRRDAVAQQPAVQRAGFEGLLGLAAE